MSTMTASPETIHVITSARPASPIRPAAVRLTRRGRLVVLAAGLLAALVLGFFLGGGSMASGEPATAGTEVLVVQPGDTLWDIAAGIDSDGDVDGTMLEIERLNALDSAALSVGQRLRVPLEG